MPGRLFPVNDSGLSIYKCPMFMYLFLNKSKCRSIYPAYQYTT